MIIKNITWSIISLVTAVIVIFFGMYGRFAGNGLWPFSGDEYLVAQSVNHILERGVPSFECGGYYRRGLLLQYILAAASYIPGISLEMKYRSVIAIFNLMALPGLYLLASRIGGKKVAVASVIFFCLSIWEIELSRYARMYVPFQTIFIWYVYVLYRVMFDGKQRLLNMMWLLSVLSLFIYEGAIFLCLLNFLPWLCKKCYRPDIKVLIYPLLILIFVTAFNVIDWRGIGAEPRYADEFEFKQQKEVKEIDVPIPKNIGPVTLPTNVLGFFVQDSLWNYSLLLLGFAAFFLTFRLTAGSGLGVNERLILLLAVALALSNQFGLMILTVLIAWLIGFAGLERITWRQLKGFCFIVFLIAVFWLLFGFGHQSWYELFPVEVERPWFKLLVVFFKYPDIYTKVIGPWLEGQPYTTVLYALVFALAIPVAFIKKNLLIEEKVLIGIILLLCTVVAMLDQPYVESKYTFFIYPLVIIIVLKALLRLSEFFFKNTGYTGKYAFWFLGAALMTFSDDFSFKHILSVDSFETNFRLGYSHGREHHLWRKFESRSAALYVNKRVEQSDVIFSTVRPAHFYLDKLDYFFFDRYVREILGVMACKGTKENWTSANLIFEVQDLLDRVGNQSHRVWLLAYNPLNQRARRSDKVVAEKYKDNIVYKSLDGSVLVYQIEP